MNLFDTEDTGSVAAPDRPCARVVRLLEGYNFRAEAVRLWTPERAETTLRACQREERIALARADRAAQKQEETVKRGQPGLVERADAAAYLAQCLHGDPDDLHCAILHSGYALTDAEVREVAAILINKFRGEQR